MLVKSATRAVESSNANGGVVGGGGGGMRDGPRAAITGAPSIALESGGPARGLGGEMHQPGQCRGDA